tara:strand:+ start:180 stop:704 length:525 start_codon:yes stop_codon:yes gene_type:complete
MSVLTTGRKLPSKKSVGGLKAIYFADYGSLGVPTITAGEITALGGAPEFFKYDINGSSSLETTVNSSRDAGSIFYTQTLNVSLLYLDKATQEEIKLIATARPHVFVEDYNGNFLSIGLINGTETTGGSIVTGAAMGDAQSFTLTMEAMEVNPPFFTLSTAVTGDTSATQITPTA